MQNGQAYTLQIRLKIGFVVDATVPEWYGIAFASSFEQTAVDALGGNYLYRAWSNTGEWGGGTLFSEAQDHPSLGELPPIKTGAEFLLRRWWDGAAYCNLEFRWKDQTVDGQSYKGLFRWSMSLGYFDGFSDACQNDLSHESLFIEPHIQVGTAQLQYCGGENYEALECVSAP